MTQDPAGMARQAEHLNLELLGAYRQGELGPKDVEAVQDHLAVCPACVAALLELRRFQEAMAADESGPSGADTEASWQALRARLAPRSPRSGQEGRVVEASGRFRRWTASPRSVFTLAAALLACLIGFPLWLLLQPKTPPVVLVQPGAFEITRGESGSQPAISVALGSATAVLSLPVPSRAPFEAYRIEIRTLRGEPRLTVTPSLVPSASRPGAAAPAPGSPEAPRLVVFALPQGSLPQGDYRLRMVGLQEAREEVLAEHRLRILNP